MAFHSFPVEHAKQSGALVRRLGSVSLSDLDKVIRKYTRGPLRFSLTIVCCVDCNLSGVFSVQFARFGGEVGGKLLL